MLSPCDTFFHVPQITLYSILAYAGSEKVQKMQFLTIEVAPFLKVKVICGHIPGQGAPYPKPCQYRVLLEHWRKVQKCDFWKRIYNEIKDDY